MTERRRYPPELREQAVRAAIEPRRPPGQVASELGVAPETLQMWVRADRAEHTIDALQSADLARPFRISDYSRIDPAELEAGDTLHLIDLTDPRGEPPHLYGMEHLWWGDYTGDAVSRSNYRCLAQEFPDSFVYLRDSMRHQGLAVLPSALGDERLAGALLGLAEYPLYKEEDLSALEAELADAAWDAYLSSDVPGYLRDDHGIDCDELAIPDQRLRELFYEAHSRHGDVYAQNAVDVVFPYRDEAVADVAAALRREFPGQQPAGPVSQRSADAAAQRGVAFPRGPARSGGGPGPLPSPPASGHTPRGRLPGR
jgi:hypothetical protein